MKINRSVSSPNFDAKTIPVEFIVIHYTACDLQSTLKIFSDKERKVSSHIVLAEDGEVYETVKCLDNEVQRAWHAGKSSYSDGKKNWENFNDFSIGIEIVNLNGNLLEYTEAQYKALAEIISHLKQKYAALNDPDRIIGHEQIAGFRGKVDPGLLFDWKRIYSACYPGTVQPERRPMLSAEIKDTTSKLLQYIPKDGEAHKRFWEVLSTAMEAASKLTQKNGDK